MNCPLAKNGNLLVVRYEDLRKDTESGLLEMLNFLGIPSDSREQVRKAIENNSLRAMREKEDKAKKSGATLGKGTLLRKHIVDAKTRALSAAAPSVAGAKN